MSVDEAQWASPDLQTLVDLFYDDPSCLGQFQEVKGDTLPQPYRELLDHSAHMTVTVERFHGGLVNVEVVDVHETATHYSRQILLRRQSDNAVVQYGIVRLNLSFLPEHVQREIRAQKTPLGRVLIEHQVLRNVKLLTLWRVQPGAALKKLLARPELETCYGRTALIYCNGVPAVELLKIVVV